MRPCGFKRYRRFHYYYFVLACRNGRTEPTFPPTLSRCSRTSPARYTRWPSSVLPSRRATRTASSDRRTQTASRRHSTGRYGNVFREFFLYHFCMQSIMITISLITTVYRRLTDITLYMHSCKINTGKNRYILNMTQSLSNTWKELSSIVHCDNSTSQHQIFI